MELSRRKVLSRSSAVGLAALAGQSAAGADRAGAAPRTARAAAPTGTIKDVQHVIVLMQENRSFDHYYGSLRGVRGFGDRSTIQLSGGSSVFNQPSGTARQYPFPLGSGPKNGTHDPQCVGDLPHAWSDQHSAWNAGKLDKWVSAKGAATMGYLTRADLPFYYALADAYTICDAYHCSVLSSTGPNRLYLFSGTTDSANSGSAYNNGGDFLGKNLTWKTYAESLESAGISWKVYQGSDNYGDNALQYFKVFSPASDTSTAIKKKANAKVPSGSGNVASDIVNAVKADVLAGTLPQVSWIVTDQFNSEHPTGPTRNGEWLVSNLLAALNADPAVLDSTVLFVNYDENDGFFDHVPPPVPSGGQADEFVSGTPVGLGFRVPMLIVSPWTRGGYVSSEVFDHSSVIQFLEKWSSAIGKSAPCTRISAWRRSVCGDLTSAFDFAHPTNGLPSLPSPGALRTSCSNAPVVDGNTMPTQEAGTKPARALPYQPNAFVSSWTVSGTTIKVNISMTNLGSVATKSAHYAAYANAFRTGGPWQYTVATAATTTDFFNVGSGYGDGKYDLTVVGPNRLLRRFTGNASTAAGRGIEAATRIAAKTGSTTLALWFDLSNSSGAPVTFTVTSNQYRDDGPWTYAVASGATRSDYFDAVTNQDGWYDFTVTVSSDATWTRRVVGHIENGQPSITG